MGVAERMAECAHAFVDRLEPDQRDAATWTFPADDERRLWFYTPTDHGGLPLGEMAPAQQQLAMRLVRSGLSEAGYVTACVVIALENILDDIEGFPPVSWTGRGRGRDPGLYYLRIFGEPGSPGWGWRFGGHHISLSFTILGESVVSATPCFFGADPATSPLLGRHLLRPLADVEDIARELVHSLDDAQREAAVLAPAAPADIVAGNLSTLVDGTLPVPLGAIFRGAPPGRMSERLAAIERSLADRLGFTDEHAQAVRITAAAQGVAAPDLDEAQRSMLREVVMTYLGRVAGEASAAARAAVDGDGILTLSFAWAGELAAGRPHYYRIQGADLLLEYDNTQRDVNHVHSVWRSFANDFGGDVLARHYADHHPR